MNVPSDDRDRRLARAIGEALETGTPVNPDERDRDFFDALSEMAQEEGVRRDVPAPEVTARIWEGIAARTSEPARRAARDLRHPARRRETVSRRPLRGVRAPSRRRYAWMGGAAVVLVGAVATLMLLRGPGASLVATAGSRVVEYVAPDGSIVTLRPGSELYLVKTTGDQLRFRLEGEAFFVVAERPDRVFGVEAGPALVEVLGTRFDLSSWGESPAVYLEEGRISFSSPTAGREVLLAPGQSSRLVDGHPDAPKDAAAEEYVDWLRGEIVFDRRPAANIAAEIEHHFGVEIAISGPLRGETLSGRILLDDLDAVLRDLGATMGGAFVSDGPRSYQFEPH